MRRGLLTVGVILIILGAIALVYQGVTYTQRERVFKAGPIEATKETRKTFPVPPVIGGVAAAAGLVLVISAFKKSS